MYSCVFKFQFQEAVSTPECMRLLAQMFELPSTADCNPQDIYWYTIKHDGHVKFWSASPVATSVIERWLFERENEKPVKTDCATMAGNGPPKYKFHL
jgi:hypothetical protein